MFEKLHYLSGLPTISREEEIELSIRIQDGDHDAREKLILANFRLVVKIAHHFRGFGMPLSDLVGEGNIGLIKAVDKYDPAKAKKTGAKFSSYASWWIKQAIRKQLLAQSIGSVLSRPVIYYQKFKLIEEKENEFKNKYGKAPSLEYLSKSTKTTKWNVRRIKESGLRESSLNCKINDDRTENIMGEVLENIVYENEEFQHKDMDYEEIRTLIPGYLNRLDEKEREIIKYRFGFYGEPETLEKTARSISKIRRKRFTRERVRQIQNEGLGKLCEMIGNSFTGFIKTIDDNKAKRKRLKFRNYNDPLNYCIKHKKYRGLSAYGILQEDSELYFALRKNNQLHKAIKAEYLNL